MKPTYNLEGDGILAVKCYEEILKIRAAISANYYPNLHAVSRESSSGNPALQQQLIAHGISCIQPGLLYFQEKLGSDTVHPVAAFKAARLLSPTKLIEIQPEAADIDTLNNIPFLSQDLNHLKEELPTYFAKAAVVASSTGGTEPIGTLGWWKNNCTNLLYWSTAAQKVFLVQPSSAVAECIFSILNRFSDTQTNSSEDYVESIQLCFNTTTKSHKCLMFILVL